MTEAVQARHYGPAELDNVVADLNRDGIVMLPGLLDPGVVAGWRDAFLQLFEERRSRPGGLAPREKERYYVTLPWVQPFADPDIFANPVILGVLDRLFPQEYVMVQLGADTPLAGSEYQDLHRDYRPLFTDEIVTPLYAVAVNFPLVEVTPENGPLELARGTHVLPRDEGLARIERGEIEVEQFLMQPGDVSIRTPLALHRGTPNRTQAPRPMVVLGYAMHWLYTPKVELTVPRALYDGLPERTRAMLRCEVVDQLEEKPESYLDFKF